jgi:DNA invertase Pin-like site-specific DNA recombinase
MATAAIYARVSSARQKEQHTIASQTAALLTHAAEQGLEVPAEWVFEDEGYSGATLVRPALERLRDLVAQVPVDVVVCHAPDRLARRYAYQALLIEELARAGTEVRFVNGPVGDRPEDQLLVQFQGMIAEYEKAQIIERTRRGKAHRARAGSVNVLSGAPYGYRYVRKSDHAQARYEPVEPQASVVRELFGRYTQDGCSIAELARWLTDQQIPTRTGKARWDRSTVWGMLRNPAYAGRAGFAKTMRTDQRARLTRPARLAGRSIARNPLITDRPAADWIQIQVPAIISEQTFQLATRRLADNQRFAARNTKVPSLLQGLAACQRCGYAYYRTSTRTSTRRLDYYRCLGSDDYRYPGGRVCANLPVRADYLDQVVWAHVTALLADPALIRAELDRRLAELHAANPATATRARLEREQIRTTTAITRLVEAYQEQLLSLDELRARLPALRAKQHTLRAQLDALDAQLVDQAAYLKLAETLESFLDRLRDKADTASVTERQRVLRLIVKEILISPERVVIRHRIPVTSPDPAPGYLLRGRSQDAALWVPVIVSLTPPSWHPGSRMPALPNALTSARTRLSAMRRRTLPIRCPAERHGQSRQSMPGCRLRRPTRSRVVAVWWTGEQVDLGDGVLGAPVWAKAVRARPKVRLEDRLEHQLQRGLHHAVGHGRDPQHPQASASIRKHPQLAAAGLWGSAAPARAGDRTCGPSDRPAVRRGTTPRHVAAGWSRRSGRPPQPCVPPCSP